MAAEAEKQGEGEPPATLRGSCFCGKVKTEARGPIVSAYACHCSVCQRLHGSPYSYHVNFAPGAIVPTPESQEFLGSFRTSEKLVRYHCKVCASHVYNESSAVGFECVDAPVATLERDADGRVLHWDTVKPQCHLFYASRVGDVNDELPKFDALPPGFEAYDTGKMAQPSA